MTDDELHALVVEAGLGRIADVIVRLARPSIRLTAHAVEDEDSLLLGASKLGGSPDLPPGCEWPRNEGYSLSFVAQINLADVAPYEKWGLLPRKGIFHFFFDKDYNFRMLDAERRGTRYDRDNPDIWRVLYWDGDTASLRRTPMPEPYPLHPREECGPYPACRLRASADVTIPDAHILGPLVGELTDEEGSALFDLQQDGLRRFGDQTTLGSVGVNTFVQMLGYENAIQRPTMRLTEVLLLQVESFYIVHEGYPTDIQWGDCGVIYYYTEAANLLSWRDFRHVRFDNQFT